MSVASAPPADGATDPTEGNVDDDELADDLPESQLEHAEISAHGLTINVSWWTLTGTTHVADQLTISTARGTLRLIEDEGDEVALPLVDKILSAAPNRWVVLGWSSYGEGMQTQHAWLVDGTGELRVVDKLEWTTDRSHGGLALEVSRKVEIGIPLPQRSQDDEDALHDESGWRLVHGAKSYGLEQVMRLPSMTVDLATLGHYYTPPAQRSPSSQRWSGRFVWFSAEGRFVLQKL